MCANLVLWILQIFLVLLFDMKLHPLCWCCRTLGDRRKEVGRKKWEEQDLWRHDKTTTHLSVFCACMAVAVLVIGEGGRKKTFCAWAFLSLFSALAGSTCFEWSGFGSLAVQARFTFGLDRRKNTATEAFQRWISQHSCWADRLTLILGQSVFLFLLILSFV